MTIKTKGAVGFVAALCFLIPAPATARTSHVEVRWNELSALILGHTVTVVLPGGTVLAGEVMAVRADSLALDVHRTSNVQVQPKGSASIPRRSITTLQLTERTGAGGRVLGVVVGAVAGMVAGAEMVVHTSTTEAAAVSTFTGVSVAGVVGGYYVGRAVDTRTTMIRVTEE